MVFLVSLEYREHGKRSEEYTYSIWSIVGE